MKISLIFSAFSSSISSRRVLVSREPNRRSHKTICWHCRLFWERKLKRETNRMLESRTIKFPLLFPFYGCLLFVYICFPGPTGPVLLGLIQLWSKRQVMIYVQLIQWQYSNNYLLNVILMDLFIILSKWILVSLSSYFNYE